MTSVTAATLHNGSVTATYLTSMWDLLAHDLNGSCVVARGGLIPSWCSSGRLADSRNEVTAQFLRKDGAQWLWWVDSDMGFPPDVVDRLLDTSDVRSRPVVGALCFGQKPDLAAEKWAPRFKPFPTLYDWYESDERAGFVVREDYPRGRVVKVAGTGAACLLIHRSVLESIADKWGPVWFTQVTHPIAGVISEDLSFCLRVATVDRDVYVDTAIPTSHEKNVFLTEHGYDASRDGVLEAM